MYPNAEHEGYRLRIRKQLVRVQNFILGGGTVS